LDCAYPRPQLERPDWMLLNGTWRFLFDDDRQCKQPSDIQNWPLLIEVPFPPELKASGIGDPSFHRICWYERDFDLKPDGQRIILHFGAVDYVATVWVNGREMTSHEGGHTPFWADITAGLNASGHQTMTDPLDLIKPRGKQDWKLEPHSTWYHRTTGIWQTVWLERVVRVLAKDSYQVVDREANRRIILSDPGIDDFRNEILWSPEHPTLLDADIQLKRGAEVLDQVKSYTALRSVDIVRDRFTLNGRPYVLRLVLDQGYWPHTLLAAPDDEALRRDVELVKAMGFNGVRKHQKIENPRYLYWADKLGLVVWEEMPAAYRFTRTAIKRTVREWTEVIERDYSHPCVIVWVPFNESWGVPELASRGDQRHAVEALYHLTKTLDPTRPVIGNDGWEASATDIIGIHDYDANIEHIR
jgi:beta-galactosidase/beta-glucuronidase